MNINIDNLTTVSHEAHEVSILPPILVKLERELLKELLTRFLRTVTENTTIDIDSVFDVAYATNTSVVVDLQASVDISQVFGTYEATTVILPAFTIRITDGISDIGEYETIYENKTLIIMIGRP